MLVVFVAPFFSPAATQMIEAALALPHIRLAVIAQQPLDQLPRHLAGRLVGHWHVADVTDAAQLAWAVQGLSAAHGAVARCFAAYEQSQLPLAIVREQLGIPGLPSSAANNFRDKARMKDVLRAAGIPVARHQLVGQPGDARRFVADVGFPIVVKPPAGAGAKATERITDANALEDALQRYRPTVDDPMLAEEFLRGTEHSLETVTINGKARLALAHAAMRPRHSKSSRIRGFSGPSCCRAKSTIRVLRRHQAHRRQGPRGTRHDDRRVALRMVPASRWIGGHQ
ncbi:ATP-grasp domain-containing protein [Gemmatimonas sp.]|uniref:ATP-grasp domain-containing protein n=1 Tax=Gemmatimonas sp. TaxID=1962908 RepID=UPI003DA25CFD